MISPPRILGFALVGLGLSILTACGSDGGGASGFTFSGDGDPPPLKLEMEVPDSVRAGDTASLLLRVGNASSEPLNLLSASSPLEFQIHDSAGERVWSSFMAYQIDPKTGERRLTLGALPSIARDFSFGPNEEVVLDAEWDTATISQETATPGVYFVSAIISILSESTGALDLLEVEPIMITVTPGGGDAGPAADAP